MRLTVNKKTPAKVVLILCAMIGFVVALNPLSLRGQGAMQGSAPSQWRPNRAPSGTHYVGRQTCAQCHSAIAASQPATAMAKAMEPTADSEILRSHPRLTFRSAPYTYQIVRRGNQSIYIVSDGVNTISEPILWSFGQGKSGQTYVFRHQGVLYESRVSFFNEIQNLDFTLGAPTTNFNSLDEAAGRAMNNESVRDCFSCHATAAVSNSQVQLDRLIPGVSCEACHGPGGEHVAAMRAGDFNEKRIFNPAILSADEISQEFCGACHRSVEQVAVLPNRGGIDNVRFQPYRLFNSRGHDPTDRRITCTACHNPHEPLKRDSAFYDSKCLACHLSNPSLKGAKITRVARATKTLAGERTAKPCPVSNQLCVTCHMPKVELRGAHFKFTDHNVRVVKPHEPYPN